MDINFELYKVFYYVATHLSFSQAAEELFISQSAVSQSIKMLEEKLQSTLFVRSTKQVGLTQEGQVLFHHIEQAFHFIKAGERSLNEIHYLTKGEVRIGASDTICKYHLLSYFQQFHQQYPHIKIRVINRTSPVCIELLKKGQVDLSVVNVPPVYDRRELKVEKQQPLQDVFVAGSRFNHLQRQRISLQQLNQYPILMLEKNSVTRDFFDQLLATYQVDLTPEIELGSVDLLIQLATIGLGISFVPKTYVKKELIEGALFALDITETIPDRSLGVMTHQRLPLPPAAQKFIELLQSSGDFSL